jgi:hypothetical protein
VLAVSYSVLDLGSALSIHLGCWLFCCVVLLWKVYDFEENLG